MGGQIDGGANADHSMSDAVDQLVTLRQRGIENSNE
jgi:hypothetical protein